MIYVCYETVDMIVISSCYDVLCLAVKSTPDKPYKSIVHVVKAFRIEIMASRLTHSVTYPILNLALSLIRSPHMGHSHR